MHKSDCPLLRRVSTGIRSFDSTIDMLRLGDNVVWQIDSHEDYEYFVRSFVDKAKSDSRKIVYMRFGSHPPLIDDAEGVKIYHLNADEGFEIFALTVNDIITLEGMGVFYVFDCLSELLGNWHSDMMIGNFFKITCPYLYELDTVAYFGIRRNTHTYSTIARIRETTQVLLDLYNIRGELYVHPLKVWERYSPNMFIPHKVTDEGLSPVTASSELSELFSHTSIQEEKKDYWVRIFDEARETFNKSPEEQEQAKELLISLLIGRGKRITALAKKYLTLNDLLKIHSRQIGSGFIGGKSVGMLIARKILETQGDARINSLMECHDSFYLGSDVFYTYLVQNGLWKLRTKQKKKSGYFKYAKELRERILSGKFPEVIREQFMQMLEYFGQSPIIVRSSSLLEDNFGNAFAGKYESVFCVNQGSPQQRYEEFVQAVKTVYASTMNEDALAYRMKRNLLDKDEQMALLVQRVSGDYHNNFFFPHLGGVGNSHNLYVWDSEMDEKAGMLRLVFGLGTRAVDRIAGDYSKLVALDRPEQAPLSYYEDEERFVQRNVDVLDINYNQLISKPVEEVIKEGIDADRDLFFKRDYKRIKRMRELGYGSQEAYTLSFDKLLKETKFPTDMKNILKLLSEKYDYPVDIEFTVNFNRDGDYKINVVQCRPLQTKGLGKPVEVPILSHESECFFKLKGHFMGGNVRIPIDYVILVDPHSYMGLSQNDKYSVARKVGELNSLLKDHYVMLVGPGRWGTTTPSLGVPVSFAEICNMSILCEVAYNSGGMVPELSFGSHFFQDLVESDIFYAAIFDGDEGVIYNPQYVLNGKNVIDEFISIKRQLEDVVYLLKVDRLELYSDILSQTVICK